MAADNKIIISQLKLIQRNILNTRSQYVSPTFSINPRAEEIWAPNIDIFETEEELVVRVELAGVDQDDIHVTLSDQLLIIRGDRPDRWRNRIVRYHQIEMNFFAFERIIALPEECRCTTVNTSLLDGILIIALPKRETSKRQHRIAVTAKKKAKKR
jgi:HSP20 family protein